MIYLDNASTTRMDPRVFEAMIPYLCDKCGNPNSPHAFGREAREAVEKARGQVAALINAEPDQIVFAHSATYANRMVFDRYAYGYPVVSAVEHSSVLEAAKAQEGDYYAVLPDEETGSVSPKSLREKLNELFKDSAQLDRMASFMLVNNETGAVNDVEKLSEETAAYWMWFHTDATAAAGAMRIDVKTLPGVDFMTFSAHKMHGPKGAAALYCRDPECALAYENEGGTPNVPAIVGFGEACRIQKKLIDENAGFDADYNRLAAEFFLQLEETLDSGYAENGSGSMSSHFNRILSIEFTGVDAETLVSMCSSRGLMISAGAACKSHEQKPSHVLTAMGLTDEEARSTVRVSFSRMTTKTDCIVGAMILANCVNQLREMRGGD